jgi:hypothetical protein
MSLVRNISRVLGFGSSLSQVAVICVLAAGTILSLSIPAAAQEGATCGMVETPEGPQFWGACPNQQSHAPVFTGTWYAAIAKSSSSPFWGASWREKSQADAQSSALSRCNKGARADCKVVVQGVNNCISLAESVPEGTWGVAVSELDRSGAVSQATNNCRKYGGRACRVVITPCGRSLSNEPQCIPYHSNDISRGAAWAKMSPQERAMWNKRPNGACQ